MGTSTEMKMADLLAEGDLIDFGDVPSEINALLQQGVATYYDDRPAADSCFRKALAAAPDTLPVYFCLYKIHTYQRNLDAAEEAARAGLAEAARQGGFEADWRALTPASACWNDMGSPRFYLYTLKALSFIALRRNDLPAARAMLDKLAVLDPDDHVGGSVVAALADRLGA